MLKRISGWLKLYEDEIALFFWTAALLFLVRISGILLNNYAETAFLKRYGVEYLPIVNMANAVATFFLMGIMTGFIGRMPGATLLMRLFLFCGSSIMVIRLVIPFGIDLIYPLLFMLKSQYEVLLALLFWNLANDLFNTRQSKRLFPLITTGGVIGQIIGSFATPFIAKAFSLDNLLFFYLGCALLGAMVVKGMGSRFPTLLFSEKEVNKGKKRTTMIEEFKKIGPLMKDSLMIKLLVLLTFLPNVAIPIMNYQFNFAVNSQFATETGLIEFFGYFRGILNIISLIILLFVGRIYGRWGLPVALMFHPFNYILVFTVFMLRFDAFTAMYARLSSNIIRTTINIPAMAVVTGLFPESYRAMVRPFLRGTVVRVGLFLGSIFILISGKFFHPKYLSLVALPFVLVWVIMPIIFKKNYAKILLDLINQESLDLKSLEKSDIGALFNDKNIRQSLLQSFAATQGKQAVWYARLLKSLKVSDLDTLILSRLTTESDDETRITLLELISEDAAEDAVGVFTKLADQDKPALNIALIKTANRLSPERFVAFNRSQFETSRYAQVKAHALSGLFHSGQPQCHQIITKWLNADGLEEKKAGAIAAGAGKDPSYLPQLLDMLPQKINAPILPDIIAALQKIAPGTLNPVIEPYLTSSLEEVRLAAVNAFKICDDSSFKKAISMLKDPSGLIQDQIKRNIQTAPFQNNPRLIQSLNVPNHRIRGALFDLIDSMDIKEIDTFRFTQTQIKMGYEYVIKAERSKLLPGHPVKDLLENHFDQQRKVRVENVLRVLAAKDRSGRIKALLRGLFSADQRKKANSLEALEDMMDNSLSKILLPLLEETSADKRISLGRKHFHLSGVDGDAGNYIGHLLASTDDITVALTLYLCQEDNRKQPKGKPLYPLSAKAIKQIADTHSFSLDAANGKPGMKGKTMNDPIMLTGRILHLKKIELFENLAVAELAAVASVTEKVSRPAGQLVIKEGEMGETLFLIIKGEVSVIKNYGSRQEFELDRIGTGDYFGEMALFGDTKRSATIKTEQDCDFLVLHKQEMWEIVREYPQIALHACRVFSNRLRKLNDKATECVI